MHKLILKHKIPLCNVPKGYRNYAIKVPDFAAFEFWSIYFKYKVKKRGGLWCLTFPLILLGELGGAGGAIQKVHFYGKNPKNDDDSNQAMVYVFNKFMHETFIAKWARRYYFRKRPFAAEPNLIEYEVSNGPMSALRQYFDGFKDKAGAEPPLDKLALPLINALGD